VSAAERVRVVFEADSLDELVRKCESFIVKNRPPVLAAAVSSYGATAANTWPVPSWAPKGSKWVPRNAAPMLLGPDGREIGVNWVAGTAQKPRTATRKLIY
jgi:hypothetical protein